MPRQLDFEVRYSDRYWRDIRAIALSISRGWCCWCLLQPAAEVHHIRYKDEHGAIAGRELAGIDIFPVCAQCHKILHTNQHWIHDRYDPVHGNHQKPATTQLLKDRLLLLSKLPSDRKPAPNTCKS